jgi:hypothetical protein
MFPLVEFPDSLPAERASAATKDVPVLCAFPSRIDPECTYIEARMRLQGLKYVPRYTISVECSPSGQLPALLLPERTLATNGILELRTLPSGVLSLILEDASQSEWAEAYSLTHLVRRLAQAVAYHFFLSDNFGAVVEPLFKREVPGPIAAILARQARSNVIERFSFVGGSMTADSVMADAKIVLSALSNRLGSGPFFYDSRCVCCGSSNMLWWFNLIVG